MIPKFRAWTEEAEVMYYNVYPFKNDTLLLSYDEISFDEVPASDFTIMQSTGLLDKNGNEIYEGDIVVAMSEGVKAIGKVKRRIDGYWLMYPAWQNGEIWHIVENLDTGETAVEIIGNIYEIKGLLGE